VISQREYFCNWKALRRGPRPAKANGNANAFWRRAHENEKPESSFGRNHGRDCEAKRERNWLGVYLSGHPWNYKLRKDNFCTWAISIWKNFKTRMLLFAGMINYDENRVIKNENPWTAHRRFYRKHGMVLFGETTWGWTFPGRRHIIICEGEVPLRF